MQSNKPKSAVANATENAPEEEDKTAQKNAGGHKFYWIICAYLGALGVGLLIIAYTPTQSPLLQAAFADIAATIVIFAFSSVFRNSSFYDPYWSVAPPLLMTFWLISYDVFDARLALILLLTTLWAIRLTHNWARGWQGLEHVDWRYVDLRTKTGLFFPIVDFLGIQMFPTMLVFIGCLPFWLLASQTGSTANSTATLTPADLIWLLIGFSALWLEFRADNVLRAFRQNPDNAQQVLDYDVWSWCRHPNYLGEIGFWLALAIAGYLGSGSLYAWAGFIAMVILFIGISIPMIDKRQLGNKSKYAAYHERVPSLIPRMTRAKE